MLLENDVCGVMKDYFERNVIPDLQAVPLFLRPSILNCSNDPIERGDMKILLNACQKNENLENIYKKKFLEFQEKD